MRKHINVKPLGNHKVGYWKPPDSTKWKPGQSGNPKGRKKKGFYLPTAQSARLEFIACMEQEIEVKKNGRVIKTTGARALFDRMLGSALQGGVGMQKFVYKAYLTAVTEDEDSRLRLLEMLLDGERREEQRFWGNRDGANGESQLVEEVKKLHKKDQ